MTGRRIAAIMVLALVPASQPARAYLKFGVELDGQEKPLAWAQTPVRYYVTDASVPGVSADDLKAALGRAFGTWQAVPTASISYEFAGFTSALPGEDDGRSTLGFLDRPELDQVLASTNLLIDDATGELLEADIFFNSAFDWSVAADGEPGRYDLQSIALHEIGHFSGLAHSALGETDLTPQGRHVIASGAVMFPIAFPAGSIAGRALQPDDIAGISDLYPDAGFARDTGSLSGRIVESGRGVFGAHVVAYDLTRKTLVGGFTLDDEGHFTIGGLEPGPYVVRAEPLDDADVDSFFAEGDIDLDFRVRFAPRLVVVPRGGGSSPVTVEVSPK
jgi:Matrixin